MRSHSQIVRDAGPPEQLAERHGVSVHTVLSWVQRNSVPAPHWAELAGDDRDLLAELAQSAAQKIAA